MIIMLYEKPRYLFLSCWARWHAAYGFHAARHKPTGLFLLYADARSARPGPVHGSLPH